ncbi:cysteine desulfurase [Patescibacteria group bacterium]|nr:cysteine desulfurase [Patescibacteria group bacterium]
MTKNSELIYLDHAATTPLAPEVLEAMLPFLREEFGNAGSIHSKGQSAKNAIEKARRDVAEILYCEPEEIIFTSGGTESDNLALRGVLENLSPRPVLSNPAKAGEEGNGSKVGKRESKNAHLIISEIEHPAILRAAELLKKQGIELTKIPVGKNGIVDARKIEKAIQSNTKLISVMLANNEIGTIQPIREIGKMIRKMNQEQRTKNQELIFHTDAVQVGGILNLDTRHLKVDLLSLSAHKFYGPKGTGILFARKGTQLAPQILGGGQERGRRAGTENVAGIVGAAAALKLAENSREKEFARLSKLRDYFVGKILAEIPRVRLNGDSKNRLPGNANFSFFGIEGESILLRLDFAGIAASSGSACASGDLEPSHVLTALGIPREWLHGSIRFTLGKSTTKKDLTRVAQVLKKIVVDLRALSPVE